MFTAQLGEAVIGADKKVVAADMVVVIVRRPVGRYGLGQFTPLELDRVIQVLPGTYSTKVYLLLVKLGWSTTKDRTGLALPIALAIAVVEGYVTY